MSKDLSENYLFQKLIIQIKAPKKIGVYYCGDLDDQEVLTPHFIGSGNIRKQLLNHLNRNWPKVTHFNYQICDSLEEAEALKEAKIVAYHPRHNKSE